MQNFSTTISFFFIWEPVRIYWSLKLSRYYEKYAKNSIINYCLICVPISLSSLKYQFNKKSVNPLSNSMKIGALVSNMVLNDWYIFRTHMIIWRGFMTEFVCLKKLWNCKLALSHKGIHIPHEKQSNTSKLSTCLPNALISLWSKFHAKILKINHFIEKIQKTILISFDMKFSSWHVG